MTEHNADTLVLIAEYALILIIALAAIGLAVSIWRDKRAKREVAEDLHEPWNC